MNKNILPIAVLMVIFFGCHQKITAQNRSASEIIESSQKWYDPKGVWERVEFQIHIQEPRPQTPFRYSGLFLDNSTKEFRLTRTVEDGVVERIITPTGEAKVLLNGDGGFSEQLKEKHGLGAERNTVYRSFYQTMYGLPMSLNDKIFEALQREADSLFREKEVYVIRLTLKEPIISKEWLLYIGKEDFSLVGLKFDHSDNSDRQDELIHFDGEFRFGDMTIPRFRHWYYDDSQEYLGSDIIVK